MTGTPLAHEDSTGTTEGPPGFGLTRTYQRRREVEAEIVALPDTGDAGFRAAVEQAHAIETVVHGIRRLLRAGKPDEARALGNVLAVRAEQMMGKAARARFPSSPEQREELTGRLAERMVRKVYDTSETAEFWEVHFQGALIKLSLSLWRSMVRDQEEAPHDSLDAPRHDGTRLVDSVAAPGDLTMDILDALEHDDALREAFARLDSNVQLAVRLKLEGLPDKSADPSVVTISGVMGKTDRTLRNYWAAAKEVLGPWLRERGMPVPGAPGDTPA